MKTALHHALLFAGLLIFSVAVSFKVSAQGDNQSPNLSNLPLNLQSLKTTNDFYQLGKTAEKQSVVILLYVSAPQCPYCIKLEEEILQPLINSGDYRGRLILAKINWLSPEKITNFQGQQQSIKSFLKTYKIKFTPTLLFLNHSGEEVQNAFVGYQANEFYWYYFDRAIEKSNKLIRN